MDARVPLSSLFSSFGVDATVTAPGEDAVETTGIWLPLNSVEAPPGEVSRMEGRRVMAFRRDEVASIPLDTLILAPEIDGEDDKAWRVDGVDREEGDLVRVTVVRDPDEDPDA